MAFTLSMVQGGSTRVNWIDGVNFATLRWKPGLKRTQGQYVFDDCELDILGANTNGVAANLETLYQVLQDARDNFDKMKAGQPYTPIFLNVQLPNGSYLLQSEVFGYDSDTLDQLLETPILGSILESVRFKLLRRWYFEETTLTQIVTALNYSNNLQQISLGAPRGDVASPLLLRVTPGTASIEDQVIAALLTDGTLANHVFRLEADNSGAVGYTVTLGADAAAYTDANFSNGKGTEIAPTATTEARRILFTLDGSSSKPVADQLHRLRVFLRGYEMAGAGSGYKWRARLGFALGANLLWGAWGDAQKITVAGAYTTSVPLLDCGLLAPPDLASTLTTNFNLVLELRGQAVGGTLSGTVQKTSGSAAIVGTGTSFTTELVVGQQISIPGGGGTDTKIVSVITNNTNLTLTTTCANSASGQTVTTPGPKFRVDCIYVLPAYEGGKAGSVQTGFAAATLPFTLDATYLGAMDGNDRMPDAYLADSSNNVAMPGFSAGPPLFLRQNKASMLYLLTRLSSGAQTHKQAQTHIVDVWYRARYKIVRGV